MGLEGGYMSKTWIVHTLDHGKIGIDMANRTVYFFKDDLEYVMDRDGEFVDFYGGRYRIIPEMLPKFPGVIIEKMIWKRIGEAK